MTGALAKGCAIAIADYSLEGKHAVVTGAGRGIGKGIALALAEAGADVAITALTPTHAERVAAQIIGMGRRTLMVPADATKPEDMDRLAERLLREFGPLDIIVNCVGDAIRKPTATLPSGEVGMSSQEWHAVVDINLTEAFESCRVFGPHLLERRQGSVINVSSFAGLRPAPNLSAYAAAKTGLHRFTESIALEWAPYGVRANVIAPGQFPDPDQMTQERLRDSEERARQTVPLGRTGRLREVGLMAVYLASDAAAYVTGAIFHIDGGLTLR